jgi:hypothetical protein
LAKDGTGEDVAMAVCRVKARREGMVRRRGYILVGTESLGTWIIIWMRVIERLAVGTFWWLRI